MSHKDNEVVIEEQQLDTDDTAVEKDNVVEKDAPTPKVDDTTEIELKIIELEEAALKSKNSVEKAKLYAEVYKLRQTISEINNPAKAKEVIINKEAPNRLDHVGSKRIPVDVVNTSSNKILITRI